MSGCTQAAIKACAGSRARVNGCRFHRNNGKHAVIIEGAEVALEENTISANKGGGVLAGNGATTRARTTHHHERAAAAVTAPKASTAATTTTITMADAVGCISRNVLAENGGVPIAARPLSRARVEANVDGHCRPASAATVPMLCCAGVAAATAAAAVLPASGSTDPNAIWQFVCRWRGSVHRSTGRLAPT